MISLIAVSRFSPGPNITLFRRGTPPQGGNPDEIQRRPYPDEPCREPARPDELIAANRAREAGEPSDEQAFQQTLRKAVDDVVRRQQEIGVDVPGDGEFGKSVGHRINYGASWNYAFQRLGGLDLGGPGLDHMTPRRAAPANRADQRCPPARPGPLRRGLCRPDIGSVYGPAADHRADLCGPLTYIGQDAIKADIANFKAALQAAGIEEGFMTAVAPGSAYRIPNNYYGSDEEFLYACAEAIREEYKAIIDAGLVLQLDDPATATSWT